MVSLTAELTSELLLFFPSAKIDGMLWWEENSDVGLLEIKIQKEQAQRIK